MKQTINLNDFRDAFQRMNRAENFSYEGLEALYNYLLEFEEDIGEEIELDVIALCCDFAQYETLADFQRDYNAIPSKDEIAEHTTFIDIDGESFIIQQF